MEIRLAGDALEKVFAFIGDAAILAIGEGQLQIQRAVKAGNEYSPFYPLTDNAGDPVTFDPDASGLIFNATINNMLRNCMYKLVAAPGSDITVYVGKDY